METSVRSMFQKLNLKNTDINKAIKNIAWLFFDKIIRMGIGVFVVILLARYLGPEQFGLFNYTTALIALFGAFSALGLNAIVTRDLVVRLDKEKILATAFGLKMLSSVVAYIALGISIYFLRADEALSKSLTLVMGLTLFFSTSDIIKYWFESQVASKYTVNVENTAFLFFSLIKIILIFLKAPLIVFAYVVTLEAFVVFLGLFYIYSRNDNVLKQWLFSTQEAKYLLSESWPLIISSAAWVIYTKIDQIMIGQMLDDKQVGLYSAASRLSEVANFLPTIIAFSVIPIILKLKNVNLPLYNKHFQQLYYITVSLMVGVAVITTLSSGLIIYILYGSEYLASAKVLSIHFWIVVFTSLAIVSGRYLVNDGLQKLTMYRHLLGVVINVPLNYVLIPEYGIEGAAAASLLALIFANYVFDVFDKKTRTVFIHKTKALCFVWVYNLMKYILSTKFKQRNFK